MIDFMPTWLRFTLEWVLLSAVLYVGLSFLSRSRGNRVLKGLLIAALLWVVGLFGASFVLGLEELEFIMRGAFSAALVVLAVVFQPELRKAFAELGSRQAQGDGGRQRGIFGALAEAATAMAERRTGALIALEGKHPLDSWIHAGEAVQADLRAGLLESLFSKESRLHDGAVIVRDGRIEAAACVLPLSDRSDLPAHFGTRHRAAVGLSEETDALLLVVSEESGSISLFQDGKQLGPFAPPELEAALRSAAGASIRSGEGGGLLDRLFDGLAFVRRESIPLLGSLFFAALLLAFAHGELAVTERLDMTIEQVAPTAPGAGDAMDLLLRLPPERFRLRREPEFKLVVRGTRAQVDAFRRRAWAEFQMENPVEGGLLVTPSDLRWNVDTIGLELAFEPALEFELEAQQEFELALSAANLQFEGSGLGERFQLDLAATGFEPSTVRVRGPRELVERCRQEPGLVELDPIRLSASDAATSSRHLGLSKRAQELGLTLLDVGTVEVTLAPRPVELRLGSVTCEVALVCLDPARRAELERWSLPAHSLTASFQVITRGLLPAAGPGAATSPRGEAIRRFVAGNLAAYVDLSELPIEGPGQVLKVRHVLREDWTVGLWPSLFPETPRPSQGEQLSIVLESEAELRLEPREGSVSPRGSED